MISNYSGFREWFHFFLPEDFGFYQALVKPLCKTLIKDECLYECVAGGDADA